MKNQDLVVVLVTSYNHEKYISETIDSIINQTYKNIKIVIVDDFSKDNSRNIIKEYARKYPNKIYYIFNEINMHVNRSFNRGLEFIKENFNPKYLASIASDDVFELDKIALQIEFLKQHHFLDAVSGAGIYINDHSELLNKIPLIDLFDKDLYTKDDCQAYKENTYKYGFGGPLMQSILFNFKSIYNVKFDLTSVSDDYSFFIRYFSEGYNIGYINNSIWKYRIHAKNTHKTMDYTFVTLDIINRFIPKKYKKQAFFNNYFMHSVYQFFYYKNRTEGLRYFIFAITYINIDSMQYFSKKFFKGFKWIWKNR